MDNPLRYQADSRLPAPGDGSRRCDLVTSVLTVTSGFMSCGTRERLSREFEGGHGPCGDLKVSYAIDHQ